MEETLVREAIPACPWTVDSLPSISITDSRLFRVVGAVMLPDSAIAVISGGTSQLLVYSLREAQFTSATRAGEGPGELRRPGPPIRFSGDSMLVHDGATQRYSVFDHSGRFVRSFLLADGPTNGTAVMGLWLGRLTTYSLGSFRIGARSGLIRDSISLYRYSLSGELLDTIAKMQGDEALISSTATSMSVVSPLFGRNSYPVILDSMLVIGDNESPDILYYSPAGELVRRLHLAGLQAQVTERDYDAQVAKALSDISSPQDQQRLRAIYELGRGRTQAPAFERLLSDGSQLWIQDFRFDADTSPNIWTVVEGSGILICRQAFPIPFRLFGVYGSGMLGVVRDPEGVQSIVFYSKRGTRRPA